MTDLPTSRGIRVTRSAKPRAIVLECLRWPGAVQPRTVSLKKGADWVETALRTLESVGFRVIGFCEQMECYPNFRRWHTASVLVLVDDMTIDFYGDQIPNA